MRIVLTLACALIAWTSAASAEVVATSTNGFQLRAEQTVEATPRDAWRALVRIQNWWNSSHTYSGDARRLRLDPRAGGCWCETWGDGQSVEHARVVLVMEHEGVRTLRAVGGLGPLQEMGAVGVLTFAISPHAQGANIVMTYRVSGEPSLDLGQAAPLVDQVLMEQFGRLVRYTASGSPD